MDERGDGQPICPGRISSGKIWATGHRVAHPPEGVVLATFNDTEDLLEGSEDRCCIVQGGQTHVGLWTI